MADTGEVLHTIRPRALLWTAIIVSVIIIASPVITWLLLPQEIQDQAPSIVLAASMLIVVAMAAFIITLGLSRVVATTSGLTIRNGPFSTHYPWHEIARITFPEGQSWAYISTIRTDADGDLDRHIMLALQRPDGDRARLDAARLQALWRQHRP